MGDAQGLDLAAIYVHDDRSGVLGTLRREAARQGVRLEFLNRQRDNLSPVQVYDLVSMRAEVPHLVLLDAGWGLEDYVRLLRGMEDPPIIGAVGFGAGVERLRGEGRLDVWAVPDVRSLAARLVREDFFDAAPELIPWSVTRNPGPERRPAVPSGQFSPLFGR